MPWDKPRDIAPKAAFIGDIFGYNCAEVIISIGFIDKNEFTLFIYNPSEKRKYNVNLRVKILAVYEYQ